MPKLKPTCLRKTKNTWSPWSQSGGWKDLWKRRVIGGFKGEAGESLPPQIFLTLKCVVCIALKIIEIVTTWCYILGLKGTKFDVGWGSDPDPARAALSAPRPPADPIPALGPPNLETICLPKYVSLNPPMSVRHTSVSLSVCVYVRLCVMMMMCNDLI